MLKESVCMSGLNLMKGKAPTTSCNLIMTVGIIVGKNDLTMVFQLIVQRHAAIHWEIEEVLRVDIQCSFFPIRNSRTLGLLSNRVARYNLVVIPVYKFVIDVDHLIQQQHNINLSKNKYQTKVHQPFGIFSFFLNYVFFVNSMWLGE